MIEPKNIDESFNREFCIHLEYHLCETFFNSKDKKIRGLWCDGVIDPFSDKQLTKKSVNDTRQISGATAFIGNDGQGAYEMTIKFGRYSLRKYAKGASLIDCTPSAESTDWITLDMENKRIEIRLR